MRQSSPGSYKSRISLAHRSEDDGEPERLARGVTFDRVSFAYPGSSEMVALDVSLKLPAGSTIALVGDNGAWKTTLIKLLCRLYEPTSGTIVIDDLPLAEIVPPDRRTRISAGSQDFARLELVARETVLLGEPSICKVGRYQ